MSAAVMLSSGLCLWLLSALLVLGGVASFSVGNFDAARPATILAAENGGSGRRAFLQNVGAVAVLGLTLLPNVAVGEEAPKVGGKIVFGDESLMSQKGHGTSAVPVQEELRYGVSGKLADKISNFNRHFAEFGGYFQSTSFEDVVRESNGPVTFYDSNTGKPLFVAPIGRSVDDFISESQVHGWPSFRDSEVVWDNVRVLRNSGETVSTDGTHLGHNLPDRKGNRYCINLVSVAGSPVA